VFRVALFLNPIFAFSTSQIREKTYSQCPTSRSYIEVGAIGFLGGISSGVTVFMLFSLLYKN
jgi:hypothetical protein